MVGLGCRILAAFTMCGNKRDPDFSGTSVAVVVLRLLVALIISVYWINTVLREKNGL